MNNKKRMYTHKADIDGNGCAVLFPFIFRDGIENLEFKFEDYHNINDSLNECINSGDYKHFSHIFITDMGISPEVAEKIDEINREKQIFYFYDHHDTNDFMNKYSWAVVADTDETGRRRSACKLLFDKYKSYMPEEYISELERFVTLVSDYDTYLWDDEGNIEPKKMCLWYFIKGYENFYIGIYNAIKNFGRWWISDNDMVLIDYKLQDEEDYIKRKLKTVTFITLGADDKQYQVGVVFADSYISALGNAICREHDVPAGVIINLSSKKIDYRSRRNDIHLGKDIAAIYGGGGHPKSAGSQITTEIVENIVNDVFKATKRTK